MPAECSNCALWYAGNITREQRTSAEFHSKARVLIATVKNRVLHLAVQSSSLLQSDHYNACVHHHPEDSTMTAPLLPSNSGLKTLELVGFPRRAPSIRSRSPGSAPEKIESPNNDAYGAVCSRVSRCSNAPALGRHEKRRCCKLDMTANIVESPLALEAYSLWTPSRLLFG